jgi:F0F1-type ATP synthase assembly protein I
MKDDAGAGEPGGGHGGGGGRKPLSSGAEFAGLGVQFAATLAVSAYAGHWLDRKLGTSPWLLILLVFAGAAAAFYNMYRKVIPPASRERRGPPGPRR